MYEKWQLESKLLPGWICRPHKNTRCNDLDTLSTSEKFHRKSANTRPKKFVILYRCASQRKYRRVPKIVVNHDKVNETYGNYNRRHKTCVDTGNGENKNPVEYLDDGHKLGDFVHIGHSGGDEMVYSEVHGSATSKNSYSSRNPFQNLDQKNNCWSSTRFQSHVRLSIFLVNRCLQSSLIPFSSIYQFFFNVSIEVGTLELLSSGTLTSSSRSVHLKCRKS